MRLLSTLAYPHRHTCEKILNPSGSEGLEWREVRALFREIAQVAWQPNGDLRVTRNGHVLILRPPPTKDVSGPDEMLELRRFLERSEEIPPILETNEAAEAQRPARRLIEPLT